MVLPMNSAHWRLPRTSSTPKKAFQPTGFFARALPELAPSTEGGVYRFGDGVLKVIPLPTSLENDPWDQRGTILARMSLWQSLNHPGIVQLRSFVCGDARLLAHLEFVPGTTLEKLLGQAHYLSLATTLYTISCLLPALAYIHSRSIVHGDLSPSNILISTDGKGRLTDFGSLFLENNPREPEQMRSGTLAYLAPERLLPIPANRTSDYFSLGAIIFRAATHKPLFRSHSDISSYTLSAFQARIRETPAVLHTLLEHLLHPEPDLRLKSVDDIYPLLERVSDLTLL